MTRLTFASNEIQRSLGVYLAYVLTGWLGLQIPYAGSHVTLMWLPTGVAVAALWSWGGRMTPAIALGSFCVNWLVGSSLPLAVAIVVGNTLAPLATVWMLRQLAFDPAFERRRDVLLLLLAAAAGMTVSSALGTLCLHFAGLVPLSQYLPVAAGWWMGDTVGVLLGAPFFWAFKEGALDSLKAQRRGFAAWAAVSAPVLWFAFASTLDARSHGMAFTFLTIPLLVWVALRYGLQPGVVAALIYSTVAAWGTALGRGAFYSPDFQVGLFLLWCYMVTVTLVGMLITALEAERTRTEATLRQSESKLRGLYELAPLGIVLTDLQGRVLECNEAFRRIWGWPTDGLQPKSLLDVMPKDLGEQGLGLFASLQHTGFYGPHEVEIPRDAGTALALRWNGMLISEDADRPLIWSIVEDITERKRAEADLRIAAAAFEAQIGIVVTDDSNRILRVNKAFCEDTGYRAEEAIGRNPRFLKSDRHDRAFYRAIWADIRDHGSWQGEIWDRKKDGSIFPSWVSISAVKNAQGRVSHYVSTRVNITERKAVEEQVRNLAFFDPLTQLPNRRLLQDRMRQALASSVRSGRHGALLIVDLDNFKTLNDTLGHLSGDRLLEQVAQRLVAQVRQGDTVARLGGDEFVILLEDLSLDQTEAASQAASIANKLCLALEQVHSIGEHEFRSSASIGVTLFCRAEWTFDDLMRQADLAMYQAKGAGRNAARFFDPSMQATIQHRVQLESELRTALTEAQFTLHFQAQVDHAGRCIGAEALVRWHHPKRGLIYPDQFIHMAEEKQLIGALGQWVLAEACRQLVLWSQNPESAQWTLAVNVSAQQMLHARFVDDVLDIVRQSGANPERLKLELTESLLLHDVEATISKMLRLRQQGIGFALDDFGTGYSSLSYVQRLPLSTLKIDRSFVRDVLGAGNDAAIARTLVALAQALRLDVVAEGVETQAQRDFLAGIGCHTYQGYYYGKPMDIEAFDRRYGPQVALDG